MFLRISSSLLLAGASVLAGCDSNVSAVPSPNAVASASPAGPPITCAIGASADFGPGCLLERLEGGNAIVLYHPDGGFRRLRRDAASGALVASDGAELLVVQDRSADMVELAIGQDRYRIPLALLDSGA